MTELLFPVAVLVGALAITYFCCLRPMRRGQACHHSTPPADADLERALSQARQELERLRATPTAGQSASSDLNGSAHPSPTASVAD